MSPRNFKQARFAVVKKGNQVKLNIEAFVQTGKKKARSFKGYILKEEYGTLPVATRIYFFVFLPECTKHYAVFAVSILKNICSV